MIPTNDRPISEFDLSAAISPALQTPNRKLLLDFYANNRRGMPNKLKILFEAIFAHDELRVSEIDLSHINLDLNYIYQLLPILQYFRNLKVLKLRNVGLSSKDLGRLQRKLELLPLLEFISLENNRIDSDGGAYLEALFMSVFKIQFLNLNKNMLGDDGVLCLIRGIVNLKILQELLLDDNGISEYGATELINNFVLVPSLTNLGLNHNPLSPIVGSLLMINLVYLPNLKRLGIKNTNIPFKFYFMLSGKYKCLRVDFERSTNM